MIVRNLGMLTRFLGVTLFMRRSGVPVRFGGFVMMRGGFVVILFWHMVIPEHSDGPCTHRAKEPLRGSS